jgi:Lar family restriction alleviation protein
MAELKPCPFCGGEAYIRDIDNGLADNGLWHVGCDQCFATMNRGYLLGNYGGKGTKVKDKIKLITAWNKRA